MASLLHFRITFTCTRKLTTGWTVLIQIQFTIILQDTHLSKTTLTLTHCLQSCISLWYKLCQLFNWSLEHGSVPWSFKCAYIMPLLKKADLDPAIVKQHGAATQTEVTYYMDTVRSLLSQPTEKHYKDALPIASFIIIIVVIIILLQ